jgi:hypothetical protein
MRTWKKIAVIMRGYTIVVLASCVAVADAAWWGAVKEKLFSRHGGGG